MIRLETNNKMDPEGHYPSKHHFTLHYFEWNSDHIALFQGRISAMLEIGVDLCSLTSSFFLNVLLVWFPAGQGLKKLVLVLFFKVS